MKLLRVILLCLIGILIFSGNSEAGRGFSSRGGGSRGWGSRPSSSSSSSWFSRPKPAPSPVYRPSPSPSYGWKPSVSVPSPSSFSYPRQPSSISSPSSLSYPRQPSGWGSLKPSVSVPKPTVSLPKPSTNFYKPPVSASKPVASAPPLPASSYPKQPAASRPIGWNVPKPSSPIGPPPAYPGLGKSTSSNVNPPPYSRYTPKSQVPAYNAPSYSQKPNPPAYTATSAQGVRPYGNVQSGNYPKQTYTSVPATQTQYGYPRQQYGTQTQTGYGQSGYGYGGGYGGGYHATPVGPPVYNHYGGSMGYGYPAGGYGSGPTIINNHYGGGGFGGYGSYGGGYGGFGGGGGGSSIGSHLLTAGLFYGLGRVTAPSYGLGSYGGYGSGYHHSHTSTNVHNTYNNYYDHGSTTTSTVLPPLQVATEPNNQQNMQQNTQQQQPSTQNQGTSPMDVYLAQPKDPYGVIIPSNSTSATNTTTETRVEQDNGPIIPRTVDLTKQKIFEAVEIPYDEVSKHKINEQPLLLNESVIRLPVYGYNFPTWNESQVVSAPLIALPTIKPTITSTTPKPEPEVTGLGAKIGKMFYNLMNWFSYGYKNDESKTKTPQVYLEDETYGRPEAEMVRNMPTTTEKLLLTTTEMLFDKEKFHAEFKKMEQENAEFLAKIRADLDKDLKF